MSMSTAVSKVSLNGLVRPRNANGVPLTRAEKAGWT